MALITCPECQGKLSDQAVSCPHCGYPIRAIRLEQKRLENAKKVEEPKGVADCPNCKKGRVIQRDDMFGAYVCDSCGTMWGTLDSVRSMGSHLSDASLQNSQSVSAEQNDNTPSNNTNSNDKIVVDLIMKWKDLKDEEIRLGGMVNYYQQKTSAFSLIQEREYKKRLKQAEEQRKIIEMKLEMKYPDQFSRAKEDYYHKLKIKVQARHELAEAGFGGSKPSERSIIGQAVAGGIIAGPAGAVVGALNAVDKNNKIRSEKK